MNLVRSSGILLHPTSFPGADGIGDLGPQAYYWVDFLNMSGCSLWQVLPLGPTGFGDSPYQAFSAFAGNPYLVSSTILVDEGLLYAEDLADRPAFPAYGINYGEAIDWKLCLLDRAFANFVRNPDKMKADFETFRAENGDWVEDFALFMAIKETQDGRSWVEWDAPLRKREKTALKTFIQENHERIEKHLFRQFLFFRQWNRLKTYANQHGVTIIGDVPIFVSMDSSDVWGNPELFYLDLEGHPTVVAGVPPDYFSPTGQLWGNPLYKWSEHQKTGYSWWIRRICATLKIVDLIRLDHFRGFSGYWEVPATEKTAVKGRWIEAPGDDFLKSIQEAFGELPFIAEDLGEISQDVINLRDKYNLPGMKILQFAFGDDARNLFLPHNYITNCIAYSGTHDNDTAIGWYHTAPQKERDFARRYLASDGSDIAWQMVRSVWESVAVYAIAPLQDLLQLGTDARMNYPGRAQGNWCYRFRMTDITPDLAFRVKDLNQTFGRIPALNDVPVERPIIRYEKP